MTSRRAWWLVMAAGLAAMLFSNVDAAAKPKRTKHNAPAASATPSCRGANRFPCGAVYNGTDYLGTDPDPFIRLMIQRDLGAKYGGEN